MIISLDLNECESKRLKELAKSLSVDPRELVRAAINSFLAQSSEDVQRAAAQVLEKNKELYERLC